MYRPTSILSGKAAEPQNARARDGAPYSPPSSARSPCRFLSDAPHPPTLRQQPCWPLGHPVIVIVEEDKGRDSGTSKNGSLIIWTMAGVIPGLTRVLINEGRWPTCREHKYLDLSGDPLHFSLSDSTRAQFPQTLTPLHLTYGVL